MAVWSIHQFYEAWEASISATESAVTLVCNPATITVSSSSSRCCSLFSLFPQASDAGTPARHISTSATSCAGTHSWQTLLWTVRDAPELPPGLWASAFKAPCSPATPIIFRTLFETTSQEVSHVTQTPSTSRWYNSRCRSGSFCAVMTLSSCNGPPGSG